MTEAIMEVHAAPHLEDHLQALRTIPHLDMDHLLMVLDRPLLADLLGLTDLHLGHHPTGTRDHRGNITGVLHALKCQTSAVILKMREENIVIATEIETVTMVGRETGHATDQEKENPTGSVIEKEGRKGQGLEIVTGIATETGIQRGRGIVTGKEIVTVTEKERGGIETERGREIATENGSVTETATVTETVKEIITMKGNVTVIEIVTVRVKNITDLEKDVAMTMMIVITSGKRAVVVAHRVKMRQ